MQILQSVFDPISIRAISQIRISTDSKPSFLWTHSCSGCFTTNSAYLAILGANLSTLTPSASSLVESYLEAEFK